MHIHIRFILLLLTTLSLLSSCVEQHKKYVIGVSQCSKDSWRAKLETELEQSTYFNEDVEIIMCNADDNMERQSSQIDSLVNLGVDLLVVSPQQVDKLSQAISHAEDKNIPVILFDRKSNSKTYAAFMGADNYKIGKMMGEYAAAKLGGQGCIVEIGGEHGSSPAIERHNGFLDALKAYPGMKIVGYEEGDWKQPSGERAMERILSKYDGPIDCVFGGNDRMALGARNVLEQHKQIYPDSHITNVSNILFLGIDALPTPGGGIEKVRDGLLTASAIYPTHGDELMNLALNILKGLPYEKENDMETSIVTQDNANVLLMQHKEVVNQHVYIKKMYARVNNVIATINQQRMFLFVIIFIVMVISFLLVVSIRGYRTKQKLNQELRRKNEELNAEKETVERQRDELEEQRDKLLDATTKEEVSEVPTEANETNSADDQPKSEFEKRFLECIEERLSDSDLSVEDIGQELCLSRVQLYRKVKAMTGKTPVEIIREERLKRAHVLLADTSLSISEIAYRVGFSAPSYFTKCYKEYYGKSPSDKQK